MNRYIRYTAALLLTVPVLTSCLDEAVPTSGATQGQVENSSKDGLVNAITKYMNTVTDSDDNSDIGYPGIMLHRDCMTADAPVRDPGYFYFTLFNDCQYLGDLAPQTMFWNYYTALVHNANIAIQACDKTNSYDALNLATSYAYRALAYMDMMRLYEFRATGTSLDNNLTELKGLTVPIVTEHTSEARARINPRAPYYKMYRFILSDLDNAAKALARTQERGSKNKASEGVVYGLKARLWLEIATRADRFPDDLAEIIAHDTESYDAPENLGEGYALLPLGITSANDAYALAAENARAAINCGYSPLTKDEWYSVSSGFNSATNNSWMWGILIGSSDDMATYYVWRSWVSFMAPEATYGVASSNYKASMMIDRNLYEQIGTADWRRLTWINPDDFEEGEEAFKRNYADKTQLSYNDWSGHAPYVGFKVRPGQGAASTSTIGNKVDIPLMRVEEMYFIEAEAAAHTRGAAAGKSLLETFMNTYRYEGGAYSCSANSIEGIVDQIITQKRIELWGEGLAIFDIRRLGIAVTRGYEGTNHPEAYRINSVEGYVPAWSTIFIPRRESNLNTLCKLNPDPSGVCQSYLWK